MSCCAMLEIICTKECFADAGAFYVTVAVKTVHVVHATMQILFKSITVASSLVF